MVVQGKGVEPASKGGVKGNYYGKDETAGYEERRQAEETKAVKIPREKVSSVKDQAAGLGKNCQNPQVIFCCCPRSSQEKIWELRYRVYNIIDHLRDVA